jgi:hypothetical protein
MTLLQATRGEVRSLPAVHSNHQNSVLLSITTRSSMALLHRFRRTNKPAAAVGVFVSSFFAGGFENDELAAFVNLIACLARN